MEVHRLPKSVSRCIDHEIHPGFSALRISGLKAEQALKGDLDRMLASGFDEYVPKPFSRLELINLIERQGWLRLQTS